MELEDLLNKKCGECGSADLEWHCSQDTNSGVVDGRLRMHEIHTIFYLGCNACSETLKIINGDEVAAMLTQAAVSH